MTLLTRPPSGALKMDMAAGQMGSKPPVQLQCTSSASFGTLEAHRTSAAFRNKSWAGVPQSMAKHVTCIARGACVCACMRADEGVPAGVRPLSTLYAWKIQIKIQNILVTQVKPATSC
jgi:hypothetical protein